MVIFDGGFHVFEQKRDFPNEKSLSSAYGNRNSC